MKALVVDDDITTRIVLQEVLSNYAEVSICTDGAEAVEACNRALDQGGPYDLICMDLTMPNMGGLEALQRIRQSEERHGHLRSSAAKVIITTASNDACTISKAFQQHCAANVVTPLDRADFVN